MSDLIAAPDLDEVDTSETDTDPEPVEVQPSLLRPAPAPEPVEEPPAAAAEPDDTVAAPAETKPDLEPIVQLPDVSEVTIGGYKCRIRRLKARETLFLLRLITRGFGPGIADLLAALSNEDDAEDRAAELIAVLVVAIPNAMGDFIELVAHLSEPLDKNDQKKLAAYVAEDLEIDDVVTVVQAVIIQEADDWDRLVGNLKAAWETGKVAIAQSRTKKQKLTGGPSDRSPALST